MRAGRLKQRVTFRRRETVPLNQYGQQSGEYLTLAEVRASVEPLMGREFFAALQVQSDLSVRIRCRYQNSLSDLNPKDQAVYCDRIFDIRSVIDVDERHIELEIMCTEHKQE